MKNNFKQSIVSQTVWPWLAPQETVKIERQKLSTALLMLAVAWTIAGLFLYWTYTGMSLFIIFFSSFVFFTSQFVPSLFVKIDAVFKKLSYYIGLLTTWVTLVPFFYLCFTMVRLINLVKNVDPMTRKYDPESSSYWEDNKEKSGIESYRRQF